MSDKIYIVQYRWSDIENSTWTTVRFDTQFEAHLAVSEIRREESKFVPNRNDVLEIRVGVYQFVELDETPIHLKDYK